MELRNLFLRIRPILSTLIFTSVFWILVFQIFIIVRPLQKDESQPKDIIESPEKSERGDGLQKVYEKGDLSILTGEPNKAYQVSYEIKKNNELTYINELGNIFFSFDGHTVYDTDLPNVISINSDFADVGAWNQSSVYLDTDKIKSITIETGNGPKNLYQVKINDSIHDNKYSIIQASINDQCNSSVNKAWVKDVLVNGYPQNIISKEYEVSCISEGELGDLVSLEFVGITKTLDKVFFTFLDDSKKWYSYDLINNKINIEQPNNLLKEYNGQYLVYDEDGNMVLKTQGK